MCSVFSWAVRKGGVRTSGIKKPPEVGGVQKPQAATLWGTGKCPILTSKQSAPVGAILIVCLRGKSFKEKLRPIGKKIRRTQHAPLEPTLASQPRP